MTRFVLASASPARRKILGAAGISPVVSVSDVDEDALLAQAGSASSPPEIVTMLAHAKAIDVAGRLDEDIAANSVLIGCDSMLLRDGSLSGKPGSAQVALAQWAQMRGTEAQLITGHCLLRLIDGEIVATETGSVATTIRFSSPTDDQIAAYVGTGEPLQVAGAFTLDGLGGWFIDGIDGDPSSVIGISLPLVRTLLDRVGVNVTDLWTGTDLSATDA
ncbi:Maf family protein [Williamsia sp.]|uniref:Maf family protein n=1 Tax=Williamsia sp. TaxID=1872085 RepID=UPI002F94805A